MYVSTDSSGGSSRGVQQRWIVVKKVKNQETSNDTGKARQQRSIQPRAVDWPFRFGANSQPTVVAAR